MFTLDLYKFKGHKTCLQLQTVYCVDTRVKGQHTAVHCVGVFHCTANIVRLFGP